MKKAANIGGIASGVLSVILSFVLKGMSTGSYEWSESYGGDAYTGIQNAAAQTANNVQALAELVQEGLFVFFFIFGLALICFFLSRLGSDPAEKATAESVRKQAPEPKEEAKPDPAPAAPAKAVCPSCGNAVTPGTRFCTRCGSKIENS